MTSLDEHERGRAGRNEHREIIVASPWTKGWGSGSQTFSRSLRNKSNVRRTLEVRIFWHAPRVNSGTYSKSASTLRSLVLGCSLWNWHRRCSTRTTESLSKYNPPYTFRSSNLEVSVSVTGLGLRTTGLGVGGLVNNKSVLTKYTLDFDIPVSYRSRSRSTCVSPCLRVQVSRVCACV